MNLKLCDRVRRWSWRASRTESNRTNDEAYSTNPPALRFRPYVPCLFFSSHSRENERQWEAEVVELRRALSVTEMDRGEFSPRHVCGKQLLELSVG